MTPGTLVGGKYRVERELGRGGMGVVVEATHVTLGTRVALKFLDSAMASDPIALARFQREARASAQLASEHVCKVTDYGVEGAIPFIVMELLTGTDLARLSSLRVLDAPTAALYVSQACTGLAEAHGAGIVHRDLKPGNLFLTRRPDGRPLIKVLDFGVAKAPVGENDQSLTGRSNVVGSQGFMSPEQFRSSKTVDGRSDIWSLGVILFKLVTNRLPFDGGSFAEFVLAISRDPVPPMPEVPPAFAAVVARCLEKDVANRYQDVKALAAALAPFAAHARGSIQLVDPADPNAARYLEGFGVPAPSPAQQATMIAETAKPAAKTILGVATPQEPPRPVVPTPPPAVQSTAAGVAVAPVITGDLPAGTIVGEYRIDRKIGEGGMGAVYAAVHPLIGKKAAIKVISAHLGADPVVVQRFVQEARSVNQIGHPNIVDVFAFGQLPDGRNYFVMEHLQGESLRERLFRSFIPLPEGLQILDEIAGALEAAHEKQIVHRDLKPDNVFLASVRGSYILVKLLDFGIAKLAPGTGIAKTSTGQMMGTPAYLSPEQARGKDVDHRTDIYALGCMIYEVVTGRIPFIAESPMDVVMMHLTSPPPRISERIPTVPPALDLLVLQMMDKDPARRPPLTAVRDVFAELVASGMVLIEQGSGVTFRSELARNRSTEARTPASGSKLSLPLAAPAQSSPSLPVAMQRRAHAPSEAPTSMAATFEPGIAPDAPPAVAPRSNRGLVLALLLVLIVGGGAAAVYVVTNKAPATAVDAGVAVVAIDAAAPGRDAVAVAAIDAAVTVDASDAVAVAPVTVDASEPVTRQITLRISAPSARLVVDGAEVPVVSGSATVSLTDGLHTVSATAPGHLPLERKVDVSSTTSQLDLELRKKARPPRDPKAPRPGDKNYTIDPFQ